MKKRVFATLVALSMVFTMAACGQEAAPTPSDSGSEEVKTIRVGVCQLVQHTALDAATQGFVDALTEEFGDQIIIDVQNASGDIQNCSTIVNNFVSSKVDLIMANATPALQAAVAATADIPILGTSVTAYPVALDCETPDNIVGGNVSGTSDLADLVEQAKLIPQWFPAAKTVGLMFCSAEANSVFQVQEVSKALTDLGLTPKEFSFTDSNDVIAVTEKACAECDVLYIPTDNVAASNAESIANVVIPAKVPVVTGEEGPCAVCGICTLSISYYDLGRTTGEMAAKILKGEADISTMPIGFTTATPKFNPILCEEFGITPQPGFEAIG